MGKAMFIVRTLYHLILPQNRGKTKALYPHFTEMEAREAGPPAESYPREE